MAELSEWEKRLADKEFFYGKAKEVIRKAFHDDTDFIPLKEVSAWLKSSNERSLNDCTLPIKKFGGRYYCTRLALEKWYMEGLF